MNLAEIFAGIFLSLFQYIHTTLQLLTGISLRELTFTQDNLALLCNFALASWTLSVFCDFCLGKRRREFQTLSEFIVWLVIVVLSLKLEIAEFPIFPLKDACALLLLLEIRFLTILLSVARPWVADVTYDLFRGIGTEGVVLQQNQHLEINFPLRRRLPTTER